MTFFFIFFPSFLLYLKNKSVNQTEVWHYCRFSRRKKKISIGAEKILEVQTFSLNLRKLRKSEFSLCAKQSIKEKKYINISKALLKERLLFLNPMVEQVFLNSIRKDFHERKKEHYVVLCVRYKMRFSFFLKIKFSYIFADFFGERVGSIGNDTLFFWKPGLPHLSLALSPMAVH